MKCDNCGSQVTGYGCTCDACANAQPDPTPDPHDRELEILRAQVRVLVRWACCPERDGTEAECPKAGGNRDCYSCVEKASRQQAEKEIDDASKA